MNNLKEIGHALKVAKTAANYTQDTLGKALGVKHQTVGTWERTGVIPKTRWKAIKEAIGLDIGELMEKNQSQVVGNQSQANQAGGCVFNMQQSKTLSTSEQALVDALRKLGDKQDETIYRMLGMIAEMLKKQ